MDLGKVLLATISLLSIVGMSSIVYSLIVEKDIKIIYRKPKPPQYYAPKVQPERTVYTLDDNSFTVENLR